MLNIASAVLKRLAFSVVLIVMVIVLNFLLIHLAPGDPVDILAAEMGGATPELQARLRELYGLDLPVHEQLLRYIVRVLHGDLGVSFFNNAPVTELILRHLWPTMLLVLTALFFSSVTGTLLGVFASVSPRGIGSAIITVLSLVGYAAPVFWTGIMMIILFAWLIPVFPAQGMMTFGLDGGLMVQSLDIAHHLVLPAFTLSTIYIAQYSRISRASMLEVLGSDYIRTARAKGMPKQTVIFKHALRNAILPVITLAGMQFGNLISGAVLVETVFSWPGLGTLAYDSILARDYPTVLGLLLISSIVVITANFLTDLCYRLADPRIKKSQG
ncbi:peptide ABC transporter permease [Antarctobacter heliothermus]|uniref:Peptide ABC transporter permease n=1 Tax=Antarctobacter heliothermus TaxID=74033 RepID=A0A222E295_9RHOB|nr:peptide ABC transporter permease [Antarctobacter heliothermus]